MSSELELLVLNVHWYSLLRRRPVFNNMLVYALWDESRRNYDFALCTNGLIFCLAPFVRRKLLPYAYNPLKPHRWNTADHMMCQINLSSHRNKVFEYELECHREFSWLNSYIEYWGSKLIDRGIAVFVFDTVQVLTLILAVHGCILAFNFLTYCLVPFNSLVSVMALHCLLSFYDNRYLCSN